MKSVVLLCALLLPYAESHKLTECRAGSGYYRCSGYDPWLSSYVYSKCIIEELICNGIKNCYYGEDEEDCGNDSDSTTHTTEKSVKDTFTTEKFVKDTFTTEKSVKDTFTTEKSVKDTFTTEKFVKDTFTTEKSVKDTFTTEKSVKDTFTTEKSVKDTFKTDRTTVSSTHTTPSIEISSSNFVTAANDITQSTEITTIKNKVTIQTTSLLDVISKSTTEIHDNFETTPTIDGNTTEPTVTDSPDIDDCIHINGFINCNIPLIISIIVSILVSLVLILCVLIHWKIKRRRKQNKLSAAQRFRLVHRRYDN